jgi:ATP adenylyltransferase
MDRLFTPWRRSYVSSLSDPGSCVLCRLMEEDDESARILLRREGWYVVLNKYPYTTGHMMLVLDRHLGSLLDLNERESAAQPALLALCEKALREVYHPHGLNVGLNLGRAAGAGVDGHLHWHLLPRWEGDANFISVVADTRVLPETLDESYRRLLPHFRGEAT